VVNRRDDSVTKSTDHVRISPDGAVLAVLTGDTRGQTVPLPAQVGAAVSIGKAKDNDLVLPDATVSRHHLALERTAEGLYVRDLGSTNGVRIGGVVVREAVVEPGTILVVGDTELLVRVNARGVVVPPSESDRFVYAHGKSLAMRRIFGLLERAARGTATILLLGETGTGKDVLARSVHAASPRKDAPFEVVDCGAIAPQLIESELFGHEKGAFTGAVTTNIGAFERASGGTIFLDELGELPTTLQVKLLRTLEAREIRRVGGSKPIPIDVRVIAATMRDLEAEVASGAFRQDLYFRLAVVLVQVPPLRSRLEDLPGLAKILLPAPGSPEALTLGPEALTQLRSHDWPGNVRELRNVLERAAVLAHASGESVLREVTIHPTRAASPTGKSFVYEPGISYREARTRVEHEFEAQFADSLLEAHGGNVAAASRAAKMDRKYLADLIRKHGLRRGEGHKPAS
jgi:DNA-binding NtrC family response regulator